MALGLKYYNVNGIWAVKTLLFVSLDPDPGILGFMVRAGPTSNYTSNPPLVST